MCSGLGIPSEAGQPLGDPASFRVPDGRNSTRTLSTGRRIFVRIRFFEFSTIFGPGLKAKMEVLNDDTSMNVMELSI